MTCAAMVAFAANSVLCRLSLGSNLIDAATFSSLRLLSGTICLLGIVAWRHKRIRLSPPKLSATLALFVYMTSFSFAYLSLTAGTGALILFGFVQLTMLGTALYRGERLNRPGWTGVSMALGGLVYLLFPGLEAPSPLFAALMAIAGLAWGVYSIVGSSGQDPTTATASNFLYATPLAVIVSILTYGSFTITWQGAAYSMASGAIASGIGYAIWYTALTHIKASSAAVIQLIVPALATIGGVLFIAEPVTWRIGIATVLTIGGIALVLMRDHTTTGVFR